MEKEIKKNNKGFSLVELIVVIAIMAVLMAVLAPAMLRYVEKSRVTKDEDTASEILNAVEIALSDDDVYEDVSQSSADITVTYAASSGVITCGNSTLLTEIQQTLKTDSNGATTAASSKTHKTQSYVVTATYSSTSSAYLVSGAWN